MEYPAIVGPAMPKRRAEIDKLTKENAGLEAKVKALEEELAQTVS
jgi:cell division protein FtsB